MPLGNQSPLFSDSTRRYPNNDQGHWESSLPLPTVSIVNVSLLNVYPQSVLIVYPSWLCTMPINIKLSYFFWISGRALIFVSLTKRPRTWKHLDGICVTLLCWLEHAPPFSFRQVFMSPTLKLLNSLRMAVSFWSPRVPLSGACWERVFATMPGFMQYWGSK